MAKTLAHLEDYGRPYVPIAYGTAMILLDNISYTSLGLASQNKYKSRARREKC